MLRTIARHQRTQQTFSRAAPGIVYALYKCFIVSLPPFFSAAVRGTRQSVLIRRFFRSRCVCAAGCRCLNSCRSPDAGRRRYGRCGGAVAESQPQPHPHLQCLLGTRRRRPDGRRTRTNGPEGFLRRHSFCQLVFILPPFKMY